jgi:hypothetical protein
MGRLLRNVDGAPLLPAHPSKGELNQGAGDFLAKT